MRKGKPQKPLTIVKGDTTMKRATLETIKSVILSADILDTDRDVLVDEIDAEIARLVAKANYVSPSDKKKAEENTELYARILAFAEESDKPVGVAEITTAMGTYSTQRITSVVNRLVADDRLIRTYDKRKGSYAVNTEWQELPAEDEE